MAEFGMYGKGWCVWQSLVCMAEVGRHRKTTRGSCSTEKEDKTASVMAL